ncbi:MAG TPA: polyphosphate kinase 2 [Vicinamibacterales bacterium]|nr:polyphosphate kinase 2 [Vicinamibacterales bacterium]
MNRLKRKDYEELLEPMQLELNNLAHWLRHTGRRMIVIFEGRDAAGKGGVINAITQRLNPRQVHVVGLAKPTEREQTQWYFQRYVAHLPAAGELVLFDRSWYNRAGVEKVMGFCSRTDYELFLKQASIFERLLTDDGLLIYKYWLAVDQRYQEERFVERVVDPLKRWKVSPIDLKAREKYTEYGRARDLMFEATHTKHAPWYVVDFNDQRRGRLNLIRHLLDHVPDSRVKEDALELPPLPHKPVKEKYRGPVKPIRDRY